VALVVLLAKATTSALGSLTSDSDHLCNGQPLSAEATTSALTTAATSAPVAYRQRRTPHRVQKGPRPRPPAVVRKRPSKNVAATSTVYNVLYNPRAASEQHSRWRRGSYGCGGPAHGATVARAVDGQPRPT
jgi:hypothetical protein